MEPTTNKLLCIAICAGVGALFLSRLARRNSPMSDRCEIARSKCSGTLFYDAGTDRFFDMHGRVGTAIDA